MTDAILEELSRFHGAVDRAVRRLAAIHQDRLQCARGCYDCCIDGITVFEVEAEAIRRHAAELLENESPHPPGRCAFLSEEGACRIYPVRPYVCRTQGLPLRWIGEREDGSLAEIRDICPLNENGEPLEDLSRDDCWTIGPFEDRLAVLQRAVHGSGTTRIELRTLFARQE